MAQFQNCSLYNRWTKTEELAYLRSSLEKDAGQVLWDYGTEVTNSLKNLTKTLRERFGGANQADKCRIELRNRRRQEDETLQSLHSDIRRLTALAFPNLEHKAREDIACDYFVDALADPDFALKVRERSPKDLDSALRIALQLEVWTKDVDRTRSRKTESTTKKTREITENESMARTIETLRKRNDELQDRLTKATTSASANAAAKPNTNSNEWKNASRRRPAECWGCGARGHRLWNCPNTSSEAKERIMKNYNAASSRVRPIEDKQTNTCIMIQYKKRSIRALIDTGSDITLAGSELAKKCRWRVRSCELKSVKVANGESMVIDGMTSVNLWVGKRSIASRIYVSSDITGFIIGVDWMKQQGSVDWDFGGQRIRFGNNEWINLHPEDESGCRRLYAEEDVILPPRAETQVPVRIARSTRRKAPFVGVTENRRIPNLSHVYSGRSVIPAKFSDIQICVVNTDNRIQVLKKGTDLGRVEVAEVLESNPAKPNAASVHKTSVKDEDVIHSLMTNLPSELTEAQREAVRQLLTENEAVFSKGEYDIGRTPLVEYRIDTGDHRPIRQPLRRQPFKYLQQIDEQVEDMRRHGIIEPAASPWASNIVLVRKKDGSLRLCVDYRRINAITYKDSYPLPLIDNCLNALTDSSWFSTLDLRSGYYNIPIAECDRDKSAFVTRSGCFRFTVMPFGMTCAPSVFQRLMDFVLCGLSYLTCLVYLDDIIVFGRTFDEQLVRLREVFGRIRDANLKLKPSKCSLMQRSVSFLGHVVSEAGLSMQNEKIEVIRDWPVCRSLTEL